MFELVTNQITELLDKGGPALLAIAVLSVLTLTIIMWKVWRFIMLGAWSRKKTALSVRVWKEGRYEEALALLSGQYTARAKVIYSAMKSVGEFDTEQAAKDETTRVAKITLAKAQSGLRPLELISTIAPLLGLLGTVLGMIVAFQALQDAGSRADPAALAGGIWEALLTTAAGMAVAIPASAALTWFESVIDALRRDLEDLTTQIFTNKSSLKLNVAAE